MAFDEAKLRSRLRALDWSDLESLSDDVPTLLEEITSTPGWLRALFDNMVSDPALSGQCERLAELDKLLMYNDKESGSRIRAHVFRQGYYDRPHNHRFWFGTRILVGAYRHTIYGDYPDLTPDSDVSFLRPRVIKTEAVGAGYLIADTVIHSVAALTNTITLTVRGPAVKDAMLIVERDGRAYWAGGQVDSKAEVNERILTPDRLADLRALFEGHGLLD